MSDEETFVDAATDVFEHIQDMDDRRRQFNTPRTVTVTNATQQPSEETVYVEALETHEGESADSPSGDLAQNTQLQPKQTKEEGDVDGFKMVNDMGCSLLICENMEVMVYLRASDRKEMTVPLKVAQESNNIRKSFVQLRDGEERTKRSFAEEFITVGVNGTTLELCMKFIRNCLEMETLRKSSARQSVIGQGKKSHTREEDMESPQEHEYRYDAWKDEFWDDHAVSMFKLMKAAVVLDIPRLKTDVRNEIQRRIRSVRDDEDVSVLMALFGLKGGLEPISRSTSAASSIPDEEVLIVSKQNKDEESDSEWEELKSISPVEDSPFCTECKQLFGGFLSGRQSRHHCRMCMHAFCATCASQTRPFSRDAKIIAESVLGIGNITLFKNTIFNMFRGGNLHDARVCNRCALLYDQVSDGEELKQIFNFAELDVTDVRKLKRMGPEWRSAHDLYMAEFAKILSNPPTHNYTEEERGLLWRNRFYLTGHSAWMPHLCLAFATGSLMSSHTLSGSLSSSCEEDEGAVRLQCLNTLLTTTRQLPCHELGCHLAHEHTPDSKFNMCEELLTFSDAIMMLTAYRPIVVSEIRQVAVKALERTATPALLLHLLPSLALALLDEPYPVESSPLFTYLLNVGEKSEEFRVELYWELTSKTNKGKHEKTFRRLRDKLMMHAGRHYPAEFTEDVLKMQELLDIIQIGEGDDGGSLKEKVPALVSSLEKHMEMGFLRELPNMETSLLKDLKEEEFALAFRDSSIVVPMDVTKRIVGVDLKSARTFKSNNPPILFRFLVEDVEVHRRKVEEVRKDAEERRKSPRASPVIPQPRLPGSAHQCDPQEDKTLPIKRADPPKKSVTFQDQVRKQVKQVDEDERSYFSFAYKRDDLRKDRVAQAFVRLVEILLNEAGEDVRLQSYKVLCTSTDTGFMEWVENAKTVSQHGTMKEILFENRKKVVDETRMHFLTTLAAYSLICLLLGLGDRHKDNLMVTREGGFFHIDYGFLLGEDPKFYLRQNVALDDSMLNCFDSEFARDLFDTAVRYFNILRKHSNLLICAVLSLAKTDPPSVDTTKLTRERLEAFFAECFCLGMSDSEAEATLRKWMQDDAASVKPKVIDILHNVPGAIEKVSNVVTGAVSYVSNALPAMPWSSGSAKPQAPVRRDSPPSAAKKKP